MFQIHESADPISPFHFCSANFRIGVPSLLPKAFQTARIYSIGQSFPCVH